MLTLTGNLAPRYRLPLLALGFAALVTGIAAGLARFGWPMPDLAAGVAGQHGAFMLCGFFGLVIGLERAVAIGRLWAYAGPLCAGAGAVALLAGAATAAAGFALAASGFLVAASVDIQRRQPALFTFVLTAAGACWLAGNAWWLAGAPVHSVAAWWLAFVVLTIAAERLELSRFRPPSKRATSMFVAILLALVTGLVLASERGGRVVIGSALAALALWLVRQDIARRTIKSRGLTRYIAACLLAGYVWLGVGGVLVAVWDGLVPGSPARDAAVHAVGVGFVFSMVFGHAPIIVPAVLRVSLPYRAAFYVPLALLHGTLLLRLVGDATSFPLARAGAMGNAIAIAAFIATMIASVVAGRRAATQEGRRSAT